jgi:hypothetical protein
MSVAVGPALVQAVSSQLPPRSANLGQSRGCELLGLYTKVWYKSIRGFPYKG